MTENFSELRAVLALSGIWEANRSTQEFSDLLVLFILPPQKEADVQH